MVACLRLATMLSVVTAATGNAVVRVEHRPEAGPDAKLTLCEVEVFLAGFNDVAGQRHRRVQADLEHARQSSTLHGGVAAVAIDGVRAGGRFSSGSCTHTANSASPWWEAEVIGDHILWTDVARVRIWNRMDCCGEALDGAVVSTGSGGEVCGSIVFIPGKEVYDVYCNGNRPLPVTVVEVRAGRPEVPLHLCEVEVFASNHVGNVAVGQRAEQGSTSNPREIAAKAVDDDAYDGRGGDGSCSQTQPGPGVTSTWRVFIEGIAWRDVELVRIYNRVDCCASRLNGSVVSVGPVAGNLTECGKVVLGIDPSAQVAHTIRCGGRPATTAEVAVVQLWVPPGNAMRLCELEVQLDDGTVVPPGQLALASSSLAGRSHSLATDGIGADSLAQCFESDPASARAWPHETWWRVQLSGVAWRRVTSIRLHGLRVWCALASNEGCASGAGVAFVLLGPSVSELQRCGQTTGAAADSSFVVECEPRDFMPVRFFPHGDRFLISLYSVGRDEALRMKADGFSAVGPYYTFSDGDMQQTLEASRYSGLPAVMTVGPFLHYHSSSFVMPNITEVRAKMRNMTEAAVARPRTGVLYSRLRFWRPDEMAYAETLGQAAAEFVHHLPVLHYEPNHATASRIRKVSLTHGRLNTTLKGSYITGDGGDGELRTPDASRAFVHWSAHQVVTALPPEGGLAALVLGMYEDPSEPSLDEVIPRWCRHDVYAALLHGVRGFLIWSGFRRQSLSRTYERWYAGYAAAAFEMTAPEYDLGRVFLFGSAESRLSVSVVGGNVANVSDRDGTWPALGTRELLYDGLRYLVMVNSAADTTGPPLNATVVGFQRSFQDGGLVRLLRGRGLPSQQVVAHRGREVFVTLPPLGVEVLRECVDRCPAAPTVPERNTPTTVTSRPSFPPRDTTSPSEPPSSTGATRIPTDTPRPPTFAWERDGHPGMEEQTSAAAGSVRRGDMAHRQQGGDRIVVLICWSSFFVLCRRRAADSIL